jgi:NAD kinase
MRPVTTQTASYKLPNVWTIGGKSHNRLAEGQDLPDLFIGLGGDGTVMRTARGLTPGIPFLTINMGRVGFMSELELSS